MHDLVIKNLRIVDGTGAPARNGDIAIDGASIACAAGSAGPGRREIDGSGLLAAPGWVDVHTHYDGQAFWDPYLTPSGSQGSTTVIMGNCGVGFAPVRRGQEEYLIGLMESVEDIPGPALAAGIKFGWESFPQYLDALAQIPRAIDIGTHLPHCALRAYVMGDRAHDDAASAEDIAAMGQLVHQALGAGALGVSTSRTVLHRTKTKEYVPGTHASLDEVAGLVRAMGTAGHGVFELVSDMSGPDANMDWLINLSAETGRVVSLAARIPNPDTSVKFGDVMRAIREGRKSGARVVAQIGARATGILMSLQASLHPFCTHRSFKALVGSLPHAEKVARMRDPQVRAQILADEPAVREYDTRRLVTSFHKFFALGDPPNYEPARGTSIADDAKRLGVTPQELAYDTLLRRGGTEVIYMPNGYRWDLEPARQFLLADDVTMLSLSDGGAHCGTICDATMPTFMLTHWVRDRQSGRLPLEFAVKRQTSDTARMYGLDDRGVLSAGMKADINLIDLDNLRMLPPEMAFDLPAGGRRFIQRTEGYKYTIVSGQIIYENNQPTGAMPGKVIRGSAA
jgi:N-acyl-D-amino-acid deacylase